MMKNKYISIVLFITVIFIFCTGTYFVYAFNEKASVNGSDSLFVVDKSSQTFFYFQKNNQSDTFNLVRTIPCTTGKVAGDKSREGDMKTPEGIYFIQGKKEKGLDFDLYGNLAFVLNFPNPVDKARGKTGHGIWIHGRGTPIEPYETRGCVAMNNNDIRMLQDDVYIQGIPVIIEESFSPDDISKNNKEKDQQLCTLTRVWAKAWDEKSPYFFSFYDGSVSKKFIEHKQRLFNAYPWIDVVVDDIQCIVTQKYSVTYFKQLYIAPGFRSEGIKRLYWKEIDEGVWKIIGSEWVKTPVSLDAKYEKKFQKELVPWLEQWRNDWEKGNMKEYLGYYAKNAQQGNIKGRKAIGNYKKELIKLGKKPVSIILGTPVVTRTNDRISIRFLQEYTSENGYSDKGMKELVVIREGEDCWRIVSERWKRMDS